VLLFGSLFAQWQTIGLRGQPWPTHPPTTSLGFDLFFYSLPSGLDLGTLFLSAGKAGGYFSTSY
jgi:hypothetical protein